MLRVVVLMEYALLQIIVPVLQIGVVLNVILVRKHIHVTHM